MALRRVAQETEKENEKQKEKEHEEEKEKERKKEEEKAVPQIQAQAPLSPQQPPAASALRGSIPPPLPRGDLPFSSSASWTPGFMQREEDPAILEVTLFSP